MRAFVALFRTPTKGVSIDPNATEGAVVGENLFVRNADSSLSLFQPSSGTVTNAATGATTTVVLAPSGTQVAQQNAGSNSGYAQDISPATAKPNFDLDLSMIAGLGKLAYPTINYILVGDGVNWVAVPMSGDGSIVAGGLFTLVNGQRRYHGTAAGTNTYTSTLAPTFTSFIAGDAFYVTFTNANTGASTLNGKNIYYKGAPLVSGTIPAGGLLILEYNGTQLDIASGVSAGAIGAVTSVGLALPASTFTVSGSPVTTSGTLTGTFATQTANTVFAGPTSGGAATPTWRSLIAGDLPTTSVAAGTYGDYTDAVTVTFDAYGRATFATTSQILRSAFRVRLASAAALPANTYNNGTAGVGATLTGNANAALSVDGISVAVGDYVLIKDEATTANNGIYRVQFAGTGLAPYSLLRIPQMDEATEFYGVLAAVSSEGSANSLKIYQSTVAGSITVGTTAVTFQSVTTSPTGTAGGDLSGTYPNPTVAKINTVALGTTTATAGNLLIGSGSAWVTNAMSGDATISSGGALTLSAGQRIYHGTAAGTNTYTTTATPTPSAYTTNDNYVVTFTNANTGAATLNANSLGAKAIQFKNAALTGGEIAANATMALQYDGTQFQLVGAGGGGGGVTTLAAVDSAGSANANAGTIASTTLNLNSASVAFPGVLLANDYSAILAITHSEMGGL